jgi:hypothetical protein
MRPVFDEARGLAGLDDAVAYHHPPGGPPCGAGAGPAGPRPGRNLHRRLLLRRSFDRRPRSGRARCACTWRKARWRCAPSARLHGTTAPDWLAREGLLSDRLIAPHATNATDEDLALYAAAWCVSVVHCPLVSARSGSSLNSFSQLRDGHQPLPWAPTPRRRHADEPDGGPDHLPDERWRARNGSPVCRDLFDAATLGGARALGRDDLGRLRRRGARPIWRCSGWMMCSWRRPVDPITTLVVGGTGKVTRGRLCRRALSMRAGRGRGHRHDAAANRDQAQAQYDRLVAQIPGADLGPSTGQRHLPPQLSRPKERHPNEA